MARTKKELVDAIVAAGGDTLNPDDFTAAQLEEKLAELGTPPEEEDTTGKILVQVNESNPKGSGSYIHPETRQVLRRGGKPTWVVEDSWTDQMVRDKFLTEVRK